MKFSSFQDIMKFAIQREEEAIKGYGDMLQTTKAPGLKQLLQELQEEERNHKKLLEHTSTKKVEEHEVKGVVDLRISDYLVEETLTPESNFQDLLIFAAKKEQTAVELYSALSKKVQREEFKKLFEFLVEQEKAHKFKLEVEYEKHVLEWN